MELGFSDKGSWNWDLVICSNTMYIFRLCVEVNIWAKASFASGKSYQVIRYFDMNFEYF